MGSKGGSAPAGNTTVTQNSTPWAGQAPFLTGNVAGPGLYWRAANVGNTPLSYFPGQTVAQFNPQQNQALGSQFNLGMNDPTMQGASQGITPYLNGSMLGAGNPYFGNMVNQVAQAVQPSIDSHFNTNGRYGSGGNQTAFANALTNAAGQMAYQNFNDQSTNQLKAFLEAPAVSAGNFNDIQQALSSGGAQQSQNQANINAAMQRFQFNQDAPFVQASRMQSLLGQTVPGGSTTTSPYFSNQLGQGLGALSTLFGGSGINGTGPSLFNNLYSGGSNLFSTLFGSGGSLASNGTLASTLGSVGDL